MSNQYEVLGKAPDLHELQKLSSENNHLTIKKLSAGYGKMEILHDFENVKHSSEIKSILEINSACKEDLVGLHGIGEFYANQIIRYRDELGGFTFEDQLLEVWKMRLETFEEVLPQIYIDSNQINKS
mgnify:CR=1 FL=1